ncbi:alpha/beta fold hydrolase [Nitrincola alkalisediminis]|uniref:alpha/beta fold hydrolase n=1 Tax=Nitrincola alkalisediminis TaxID=1366656 RepID=UPI001876E3DB|nr:alpha/beta hydrolase [Nitrincola alkalisediminis]
MSPVHHFIECLGLEVHVTTWGNPSSPCVVLWHGLTRTGRDFDELAQALSLDYFVLCPDTPGRGLSQWCEHPEQQYTIPFYAQIANELIQYFGVRQCKWVGTSMGGLIGIYVAHHYPARIASLLVNDVAPEVPALAVERIRTYVSLLPTFRTFNELEAWFRQVYVSFGCNTDVFWQRMAITSARRTNEGHLTLHYDPRLVIPFQEQGSQDLWDEWSGLAANVWIIRGEMSDVLLPELAEKMLESKPQAQLIELSGVGHAPTLVQSESIELVKRFLAES